jgi:hypothetical protein
MKRHTALSFATGDKPKLDRLIGTAIIDDIVYRRLIDERDTTLFEEYDLSPITQAWLSVVHAPSLTELADAIMAFEQKGGFSGEETFTRLIY